MTDHIGDANKKANILKAAKAAGGTTYTNRRHDGTACAFGPDALERFYAIAYRAGLERAAEICEQHVDSMLAAQKGSPDDLANIMIRQVAHLGAGICAADIRAHAQNIDMTQPSCTKSEGN